MHRCDVLIVGGGPAGSSCARRLLAGGVDCLVIDKQTFPRDKTCAGWVTPPVLDELDFDGDDYRRNHVWQPIRRFRTGLIGGPEVFTDYGKIVSYGIRRCEWDYYLLQSSGAACRLGEPVRRIDRRDGRWLVNDEISAGLLIGAGGHFCPVARHLGGKRPAAASIVTAQEVEFAVPPEQLDRVGVAADTPELFFCDDLRGYGWCFRKGDFLNIGLGRVDPSRLAEHVARFCEFLRERGKVNCELPARFHGHAYQLYERAPPRLTAEGALLVGDAAGLAYPQSGEGIRPAVESGLLAAEAILQSRGRLGPDDRRRYEEQIRSRFGRPRQKTAGDWLPAGWLQFLAARLMSTAWFSKKVVLDQWFLHTAEKPLHLPPPPQPATADAG